MGSASRGMHVGGIKDYTVNLAVGVGKPAAIYTVLQIGSPELVSPVRDVAPKTPLP